MLLSRRKFAKHVNLSHTRINKLVNDGVIPLHDGKIELNEGIRLMKEHEDPSRDAQRKANAKRRKDGGVFADENLPEHSLADMDDNERAEYNRQLAEEQEQLKKAREEAKEAGMDIDDDSLPGTLTEAKLFREYYMGKTAELDFKRKNEELVLKADVDREYFELGRLIRDSLLNIPHKLSLRIAGRQNPKEIEALIEDSIIEVLGQMS